MTTRAQLRKTRTTLIGASEGYNGNKNRNLLRSEPSAIFHTIGSSRSGVKPIA